MFTMAVVMLMFSSGLVDCSKGEHLFLKFMKKLKQEPKGPMIREPRHHKWRMNYADNDNHDMFTTTTTTTTKSPEQIIKDKEEEMRRINPKGFLIGSNKEKNKEKEKIFGKKSTIDKEVEEMRNKLEAIEPRCLSNDDCTKETCCMINPVDGIGKCIMKPHKLGQKCNAQCACTGLFTCKKLEKVEGGKDVSIIHQCANKSKEEIENDNRKYMQDFAKHFKNAKKKIDPKKQTL